MLEAKKSDTVLRRAVTGLNPGTQAKANRPAADIATNTARVVSSLAVDSFRSKQTNSGRQDSTATQRAIQA